MLLAWRNAGVTGSVSPDGRCKIVEATSGEASDYASISRSYVVRWLGRGVQGDAVRRQGRCRKAQSRTRRVRGVPQPGDPRKEKGARAQRPLQEGQDAQREEADGLYGQDPDR